MPFPYHLDFDTVDFRQNPELYQIGRGEQGVLLVQPYKSEILPHWRFKTPEIAEASSQKIYDMFLHYLENDDFVGADMARKFLQMGFTRARRYANHKSGKKYSNSDDNQKAQEELAKKPYPYSSGSRHKNNSILPQEDNALTNEKAKSAEIFKQKWFAVKDNPIYKQMSKDWREKKGFDN